MPNTTKPSVYDSPASALRALFPGALGDTLGEFFPNGSSLDLLCKPESDHLQLVYFHDGKTSIDATIKVGDRVYAAAQIDRALVRATVFPSRVDASFRCATELFAGIREVFVQRGFSERVSDATAHFVFATWFPELLPIAPCLLISGPPLEANFLLDILECLVRRPLHFGELNRSVLGCLPFEFRPTLLLNLQSAGRKARELLRLSSRRGCQLARGTNVVTAFHSKAIYCGTALTNDDLGGGAIRIHLVPIRGHLPLLSPENQLPIADEFQPKLMAYRAAYHGAVSQSEFDAPEFTPETRILARVFGTCIVGSREVQAGLKNLLQICDEEARAEHWCDVRCVAIEALLAFCHTRPDAKIYVGEVTKSVDEIQQSRGEAGALDARRIGDILRSLGIHSKRDRRGFSIVLTEKMRRQVHELARDFEVAPLEEGAAPCSLCAELLAAPGKMNIEIAESGAEGEGE
jgi:hypothetical protein